ncbi:MAG: hypothetical protein J6J71_04810 [Prevotella sp.]|nr:hypothetical protein [Prevotella sp.]
MKMIGRHKKVRIRDGERELTAEPFSAYDYEQYAEEFPREVFEPILEKTAKSVDLGNMIIYCED